MYRKASPNIVRRVAHVGLHGDIQKTPAKVYKDERPTSILTNGVGECRKSPEVPTFVCPGFHRNGYRRSVDQLKFATLGPTTVLVQAYFRNTYSIDTSTHNSGSSPTGCGIVCHRAWALGFLPFSLHQKYPCTELSTNV